MLPGDTLCGKEEETGHVHSPACEGPKTGSAFCVCMPAMQGSLGWDERRGTYMKSPARISPGLKGEAPKSCPYSL